MRTEIFYICRFSFGIHNTLASHELDVSPVANFTFSLLVVNPVALVRARNNLGYESLLTQIN
jgi:hypothetical protein